MSTWKIPGQQQTPPAGDTGALQLARSQDAVSVETTDLIRVGANRAGGEPAILENVADDDLLEIELEGGVRQWILAEQFRKDFLEGAYRSRGTTVDTAADVIEIDPRLNVGNRSRGITSWVLKGVRRLKVTIADRLLDEIDAPGLAASALCAALEKKFMPQPGFKRWGGGADLRAADASSIEADKPTLIFIHGTFSSTGGSFGDLSQDAKIWGRLKERYGDRIFALDHHTIGQNPIENALDLVRNLPPNARIHLVSHSRGGMIGELVCRGQRTYTDEDKGPFDALDFKAILGDPDDEDQLRYRRNQESQLREFDALLRDLTPRVERFVRVAAPAAGTSLASERLDRWLSILLNSLKLVPALAASPTYELVSSFTAAVLKKRLDPGRFPGIEAMRPISPLVRLLNRHDVTTDADLTVIAGDLDGSGIWGSVKHWVTDLIYAGDHDIVVNTPSMYGGAQRARGVYFFDHGAEVDHFHYFSNERTSKKVGQGLAGPDSRDELLEEREKLGFLDLGTKRKLLEEKQARLGKALVRGERDAKAQRKPVVFVLPGIMGSALAQDGDGIWVNPLRLALGRMGRLRIDAKDVTATELLAGPYGDLIERLSVDHAVKAFPYDWRLSLSAEAKRLAVDVRKTLKETEQPVRLLAHSLGGLLARTMFAQDPELWEQFQKREGNRLVMLGTPNAGSFKITRVLLGKDKLLRILSLVDLANSKREMVEIVSRFPGILELLPDHADDYFDGEIWSKLTAAVSDGWPAPLAADLAGARKVRQLINSLEPDKDRMFYVAGLAGETPVGVELDASGRLRFMATREGDGSVPWKGGVLPGLNTWYMDAEHGKLADHEPSFGAIEELLASGDTAKLSRTPPAIARDADGKPFEMTEETIEHYPEEIDLQAAAVGYSFLSEEPKRAQPLQLSVRHGDLRFVSCPVMAGHHDGDAIFGAERALDQRLGKRLSDRLSLGLYAGPIGSSAIVLDDCKDDNLNARPGAIIVGLGSIGKLLPSGLKASVSNGALRYALQVVEEEKTRLQGKTPLQPAEVSLCSLVIGSEFGGLTTAESMGAILKGVLQANEALEQQKLSEWVRIGSLQFVELYRDRAIQTAQILLRLRDDAALHRQVIVADELIDGESGRARVPPDEASSWWHRLQISSDESTGALSFTTMTGRARADINVLPLQLENVRRFVEQSITRPNWNAEVANTLFHMLLPNELKPMALEERNLVMLLGSEAAAYPWELLHDQTAGPADPLVTRSGLIRQLATGERGRPPVDNVSHNALVVGNPPTHLLDLPGAETEAREVAGQLRGTSLDVTTKIGSAADEIQLALFSKPYQILHLAGHGEIDRTLSERNVHNPHGSTGMVIGHHLYLTPAIVAQLPRVPELVFINCCHLGAMQPEHGRRFNLLAANLGTQFIRDGVSAVVAAGWAVDDAAAATFAREFYRSMIGGETFGDAVRRARKQTYQEHPRVNTFGAYQCYGDPNYRLKLPRQSRQDSDSKTRYVSPDHAAVEFDNLRHGAKAAGKDGRDWRREKIRSLVAQMPDRWIESSSTLNAAIGEAYGEVGLFDEAIEAYGRALRPEKADAPLRILEQRGNLLVRRGEASQQGSTQALALIEKGRKDLELLLQIEETVERHNLMGGSFKRQYQVKPTKRSLEEMAKHYRAAYELATERGDLNAAYPLTNWLAAELGLHPITDVAKQVKLGGKKFDCLAALDDAIEKAKQFQAGPQADTWASFMPIDCRVMQGLFDGSLPKHADEISADYRAVRVGSARERNSVADNLRFLERIVKAQNGKSSKASRAQKASAALQKIAQALES